MIEELFTLGAISIRQNQWVMAVVTVLRLLGLAPRGFNPLLVLLGSNLVCVATTLADMRHKSDTQWVGVTITYGLFTSLVVLVLGGAAGILTGMLHMLGVTKLVKAWTLWSGLMAAAFAYLDWVRRDELKSDLPL